MARHTDGSPCKQGTREVPVGFQPCCDLFLGHLDTCSLDVRYEWWPEQQFWVIAIDESAGSGGVWMAFCPHCGKELRPRSTRPSDDENSRGQPGRWLRV